MSLYQAAPGTADPAKFNGSMAAVDLAVGRALGSGVLSGFTIDAGGTLQPGEALIGHVVALAAAFQLNTGAGTAFLLPSATNYVYLQMPPAPACVGLDGRDAGVVVVNQSGAVPVGAVLLGTVTTGPITSPATVPSITAVNNAPLGRRNLAAPLQGQTLITLNAQSLTLTPGANYLAGVDFSAAGTFPGARYRAGCACSDPNVVVSESLGQKSAGKMFFTLHYILPPGGSTAPVSVSVVASADGRGYTGQQTAGIAGAWGALTTF